MGAVRRLGRKIDKAITQPILRTVEAVVSDPKKLLAVGLSVAFPGAGAALGAQLGLTGAAAQVVGQTLLNTALNGGDVKSAVLSAAIPVMGGPAAEQISKTISDAGIDGALNKVVTNAATKGLTAAVLNQDIGDALVSSLVQSAPSIVSQYVPQFAELPRAVQEAAVTATSDLLRTGGTNLESIALSGVANAATDYAIKNVQGYDDLRPGQKEIVRNGVSNLLQGKNVTATLLNGAISFGQEAVQNEINENKAKDAGWADYKTQQAAKSMYGPKVTPELYADKQETTEAEAKDIARQILGREPTEFEYMQLIGLPEREAAQNSDLQAIQYDESTFDSNELIEAYKGLYGKEPTAEWLASDEAMDMLGRSEAQGTNELQNYYTKDKNWVTEDEAAQFWKDMGNTGPAPQEFLDAMLMTTENGAKAMAEAHRINAEDIAATTFDGSQYETPQEAAAAAKAAGFNAFTHKDKNLTYFTQPSPIEEANIRADVEEKKTFGEAFAAARKELGAGKTFTWNGKQYTTNVMPKDTFDASRSSTITTAATLALANGKDKFIGPDGKTYKLDDNAKSVLANSVNQSAAETQRLLNLKPTTDETPAETQRLMEAGTRGTMDAISAKTAQVLGATQRGFGQFLSNAGKSYAAMTGDLDFDNAAIKLGKEIEAYAKGNDVYGLDVQKNRLSQALAQANETDNWVEKIKIIGPAIGKNSIGFFDIAFSEAVEELPETVLQIGAALMTGGSSLGAMAAIGAAGSVMETFGSTVEETYNKSLKAGDDKSVAMNKAYLNGVLSTAIEAGTNFVADKALLAPFLNKFTGTLAGTATGFISSTTIGAASELAAGLSQSYATQYIINPETASLSKAATDGIFEMFIGGTAQGTMGLPGYAIQGGAIIGRDYSGKELTMADVAAGAVLDSSTVDPNATIATSEDGDPVTLGGAMLQMPNYQFDMSTLKTYVPQVFNNDDLVVGQDELGNTVTYGDLLGQTTESKGFDAVYKSLMDITPEQRTEAKYDFVSKIYEDLGYTPTAQEINDLIAQNPAVSQIDKAEVEKYIDPRMVTEQEARDAYAALGLAKPTQADVLKLVGQYDQTGLTDKATANLDSARYNSILDQLDSMSVGASQETLDAIDLVRNDLNAQITALGGDVTKLQSGLDSVVAGQADAAAQLTDLQNSLAEEIQAAKDIGLEGDAAIQAGLDSLAEKVGTNQADLLTQLGTTADDLRAQFATDIAASQEATAQEIADTRAALETAIADAKAAGLEGDAALQAGIDSVAVELGTTKEALLTQLGTTEETLRTEFATGISGLETQMQEQYEALTTAQRETADALVAQGKTLADAIATAQESTATQIADVETRLTDAIAAAEAAGLTRDEAITSAVESVAADLGTTKADLLTQLGTTEETLRGEFATGLAGVSAEVQAAYDSLSAEQKALATQLTNQGSTLAEAIETVRTETAGQIDTLSADMQAKYEALTDGQKALANDMAQQGLDLTAAINLAAQQTQEQITGLGEQVDLRINELMQQGQTYQEATQQAIGELNTQNQQLQGLIGNQGRSATQDDIDALSQMLGGQRDMDLTYDVTGDKQITQADIDFLTQVVGGTNTDWKAPVGSAWGATGLYGQLAANEAQRQADLQAQLAREQQAAAAAAEAAKQANIQNLRTQGQQGMRSVMDQLQAVQAAGMAPQPVQVVEAGPGLDISDKLNTGFFSGVQAKKEQQKQPQTTKIAAGGYIDDLLAEDMSVDDLLNLLR